MKWIVCLLVLLAACSRSRAITTNEMHCPEPPQRGQLSVHRATSVGSDSIGLVVLIREIHPYAGDSLGKWIDGASLSLYRTSHVSGRPTGPGTLWFPDLPSGHYRVDARQLGYNQVVDSVFVRSGFRDTVLVGLQAQAHCLI